MVVSCTGVVLVGIGVSVLIVVVVVVVVSVVVVSGIALWGLTRTVRLPIMPRLT